MGWVRFARESGDGGGGQTVCIFLRDCLFSSLNWSEAHRPFTQFLAKFKPDLTSITLFLHPSIQLSPQTTNDSHV